MSGVEPTVDQETIYRRRREIVFLILSGLFLGCMAILNVIGITKFIQIGPLTVAVGVLPYPLTFLCTDLISEFYGRKRATLVVWVGLLLNLFVIFIMWLGHTIPAVPSSAQPPWQMLELSKSVYLPNGQSLEGGVSLFHLLYACTAGAVLASMLAYMAAQFCDVYLFHFWKRVTKGKHLWLRNNASTVVSQLIDSFMVISVTFGAAFLRGEMALKVILGILFSNYLFKFFAALVDTAPIYALSKFLKGYLNIDPTQEQPW